MFRRLDTQHFSCYNRPRVTQPIGTEEPTLHDQEINAGMHRVYCVFPTDRLLLWRILATAVDLWCCRISTPDMLYCRLHFSPLRAKAMQTPHTHAVFCRDLKCILPRPSSALSRHPLPPEAEKSEAIMHAHKLTPKLPTNSPSHIFTSYVDELPG